MGFYLRNILTHRSGRQSYRKGIPEELRPFCGGKHEFKVSLGFPGSPGFHARLDEAIEAGNALFARARRQLAGAYDPLDPPTIAYLAELFRVQALEGDDEARHSRDERELFEQVKTQLVESGQSGAVNWHGEPVRRWSSKARATTEAMLNVYRDLKAIGDLDGMAKLWLEDADDLIEAAGLVIDPNATRALDQLYRALNDAAIGVCQDKLRRLEGEDVPTPPEPSSRSTRPSQESASGAVPLLTLYESYAKAQGLTPGVRDEWRHYIDRLVDFLGHDDAARITAEQLMEWRDLLLREPSRKGKLRDPSTVRDKYITSVRATLAWAVEERKLPQNVAAHIVVRVPKKAKLRDKDFTPTEAKAILKATLEPASSRLSPTYVRARRWIPWLCAYTGGRVNEFSQLRGEDVKKVDGIWCVRITPEAGTVKANEARTVPLHEHLIEQGFLAMVKEQGPAHQQHHLPGAHDPELPPDHFRRRGLGGSHQAAARPWRPESG